MDTYEPFLMLGGFGVMLFLYGLFAYAVAKAKKKKKITS